MIAVILFAVLAADPQTLTGRVVSIADGDTLTVLDTDKVQHRVRLNGIDAPEKSQPFGTQAKEHLSELVAGKDVRIEWKQKDRYGRILGDVRLGDRNINREMVEVGFAWHYRQYSKSKDLQSAEDEARKVKRGLWGDTSPVAPWEWRREKQREKDRKKAA